eukprot:3302515-Alexandrium_andersonii.AAC.1
MCSQGLPERGVGQVLDVRSVFFQSIGSGIRKGDAVGIEVNDLRGASEDTAEGHRRASAVRWPAL